MKCSCVVLNYNDSDTVIEFIQRIRDYKNIENIVIVDNMSTDESFERLSNLYREESKINILQTDENKGYGYGNNYGVSYVYKTFEDKYTLISNPDVIFSEEMLNDLLDAIDNNNVSVVSGVQFTKENVEIADKAWKVPNAFEYIFEGSKLAKLFKVSSLYKEEHFKSVLSRVDCVPGAMLLVNTKDFLDIGGYDDRMFLYCEETTLGYKLMKAELSTLLVNNAGYIHIGSTSTGKELATKKAQKRLIYNSRLFFLKNYLRVNRLTYSIAKWNYNRIVQKMK